MAAFRRRVHMSNAMNSLIFLICLYFAVGFGAEFKNALHRQERAALDRQGVNTNEKGFGRIQGDQKLVVPQNDPAHQQNLNNQEHKVVHPGVDHMEQHHAPESQRTGRKSAKLNRIKISESDACSEEVRKYCNTRGIADNNFAQLDCLQNDLKVDQQLSEKCHHFLWQYKMNLTKDDRFEFASAEVCEEEVKKIPDCGEISRSKGHLIPCLLEHKEEITTKNCRQFLNKMASIVFSDYRLVYNFVETCQASIEKYNCGRVANTNYSDENHEVAHSQGATLDCLAKHVTKLDDPCKLQLLRVAELQADDYHFDRPLYYACREAREIFCASTPAGDGQIYKCLYKHKMDPKMNPECRNQLQKRQKLINEDVKVDKSFFGACKDDIKTYQCFKHLPKGLDAGRSTVLLCLENIDKKGQTIAAECLAEMAELRESLMEDYQITPDIVSKCAEELKFCGDKLQKGGETLHCLMDLARPKTGKDRMKITTGCKVELEDLLKEADVGENYLMDPALHRACQQVVDVACQHIEPGDSRILNCLMDKLDTDKMTEDCGEKLLEMQYFVVRDFKLDDKLYKKCHKDAEKLCGISGDWLNPKDPTAERGPLVLPCLYRHFKSVDGHQTSKACRHEVKHAMKMRAKNVDLMPEVEDACLMDLGDKCSSMDEYERGEELKCLQDNYDDLRDDCKKAVGDFIEEEDEDLDLDVVLKKACLPMIQKFCGSSESKPSVQKSIEEDADAFEILDCLIEHKHHPEMNSKCAAGVEHHQIISLKDIRFSYKFKEQCKPYITRLCSGRKTKMEVVTCLSEIVRNDTLFGKTHTIEKPCRKQLKAQLLQREENIDLDPALKSACEDDVRNFCSEVTKGNAKVIECLRQQPKLSPKCHKMIFKREKDDLALVDYTLQKACKRMIKMYCDSINDPVKILPCLRNFKSKPEFDPTCRKVVVQRQVIQNKDYRINPSLQKSCYRDIPKFCSDVLKEHNEEDEFEGKVINCLKKEFVKRRLSTECANEIHMVMKEAAADYRQDPVLAVACRQEISQHCSKELEEVNNDEAAGKGLVEECLKNRFHDKVLKNVKCIKEVARLVQEGHVDINVDPELHRTCNKDLSRHCPDIEPGEGRLMSCLLVQLEDKPQRLQPECRKMLQGRKDMWEYAAQVAPVQGFSELVDQITISPSRNYILGILVSIVGIIFIMGITCGRVTKKVTREMKNR